MFLENIIHFARAFILLVMVTFVQALSIGLRIESLKSHILAGCIYFVGADFIYLVVRTTIAEVCNRSLSSNAYVIL